MGKKKDGERSVCSSNMMVKMPALATSVGSGEREREGKAKMSI